MSEQTRVGTTLALAGLLALVNPAAQAAVRVASVFTDHMVLQQGKPVAVWGVADPGEKVVVRFGGQTREATTEADGRWLVRLAAMDASPEPRTLAVRGAAPAEIAIRDVLVGEVWICAGQSNMGFALQKAQNGTQDVARAGDSAIRLFRGGWQVASVPQREIKGEWTACTPETAAGFSAVAYYFGRGLRRELNVPVGLIQAAWDWTPAEAWMTREGLSADPAIKAAILDRWDQIVAEYPQKKLQYDRAHAAWEQAKAAATGAGQTIPTEPKAPADTNFFHRAASMFNGGIAPLIPFAMRGVIWYQGETNDSRADQYRSLFPLLIRDWRQQWQQGPFPFLYVQVSSVGKVQSLPVTEPVWGADWAELREAQLSGLALTNTAMAVTIDLGDGDVHPANKQDVGKRLVLAARAVAYGQKIAYKGPVFAGMAIEGGAIRLRFNDAGAGLVAADGELTGFTMAGADRRFVPAQARIDGDTVIVHADQVAQPVAVRYAWANRPPCNLYNREGLPASPFRTDDWPGNTYGKTRMFVDEP